MEIIFKFSFPDDQEECDIFYNAQKLHSAVWDFDQWLRSKIKHEDKDWDEIRDKLHDFMAEWDLNLY